MFKKKDSILFSSTFSVKILHTLSYSRLLITLSCKDFLYSLSKDFFVCWLFVIVFDIYCICL